MLAGGVEEASVSELVAVVVAVDDEAEVSVDDVETSDGVVVGSLRSKLVDAVSAYAFVVTLETKSAANLSDAVRRSLRMLVLDASVGAVGAGGAAGVSLCVSGGVITGVGRSAGVSGAAAVLVAL